MAEHGLPSKEGPHLGPTKRPRPMFNEERLDVNLDDASTLVSLLDNLGAGDAAKDQMCSIGDAELAKFREETIQLHQRLKSMIHVRSCHSWWTLLVCNRFVLGAHAPRRVVAR